MTNTIYSSLRLKLQSKNNFINQTMLSYRKKRKFLKDKVTVIAHPDFTTIGKRIHDAMDLSYDAIRMDSDLSSKIIKSLLAQYKQYGTFSTPSEMVDVFYKNDLANDLSQTYWDRELESSNQLLNLYSLGIGRLRSLLGKKQMFQGNNYDLHKNVNLVHLSWNDEMRNAFKPLVEMMGVQSYQQGTWKTAKGIKKPRIIKLKDDEIMITMYCIALFKQCSYTFINEVFRHIQVTDKKSKKPTQKIFIDRNKVVAIISVLLKYGIIEVETQGGMSSRSINTMEESTSYIFKPCHTQSNIRDTINTRIKDIKGILDCV